MEDSEKSVHVLAPCRTHRIHVGVVIAKHDVQRKTARVRNNKALDHCAYRQDALRAQVNR